ncbi:tRNA (N6-isopentenyl adenosine(37)-C2)-methylthiotransferase MiaB [Patescibacteria group bacterium]|nr:tRNA (N6-isopentenyl adenosine(37)-C2)-methylthiotransferase MiaB [Patescibacteria group bacterium]
MKYHIITFGCQMNENDSIKIKAMLQEHGLKPSLTLEQSDIIIVNMCSVRQSAVNRVFGLLQKQGLQKKNQIKILFGCVLPADKKKLSQKFNLILNINKLEQLKEILPNKNINNICEHTKTSKASKYVPIMTGCNNFCTYCVVPYTRGREISKDYKTIIKQIKDLLESDTKEITLLGQNVNSYKDKNIDFPKLLKLISKLPKKFWLRFLTSHPKDISNKLINVMANNEKITEYLHLPVQSGNNEILDKMNRGYTIEQYKKIITHARNQVTNICISTDIIVGFPGETKQQFEQTARLMKCAKFDMAYIAEYSPRPNTPAKQMKNNVPQVTKSARRKILDKIIAKTALENNKKYLDKVINVLINNKKQGDYFGKTSNFKNIKIKSNNLINDKTNLKNKFVKAKVTSVTPWNLEGLLIKNN